MSDDELLAATARGESAAFGTFYRRHIGTVLAFLLRRTGSAELAGDLAGETFAAALLACRRYRAGEAPALSWLLGIAANKLRESARRGQVDRRARARLAIPPLVLEDDDLLAIAESAAEGEAALRLLEDLPAAQRDAVRARVIDERDYRELARELRCSEAVVRQQVSRGLRRLKAMLGERR